MSSVPLHCSICPKGPKFSDISHLLTHVGSKGHLAHHLKVQLRSRHDQAARNQLELYRRWHADNNLEKLLSDRYNLKESKTKKTRQKAGKHGPCRAKLSGAAEIEAQTSSLPKDEDTIDPQFAEERELSANTPSLSPYMPIIDPALEHRSHVPRMRLWPTPARPGKLGIEANFRENASTNASNDISLSTASTSCTDDESEASRVSSLEPGYPDPTTLAASVLQGPFYDECQANLCENDNLDGRDLSDADLAAHETAGTKGDAKLKGVYWPGMAIFDSASPDAKRKRNQKKKGSVLEQMEMDAERVEPIELIFRTNGELKKQRPITGKVDDSSSVTEETPKKVRPKRKRAPLAEVSTNKSRIWKRSRGGKTNMEQNYSYNLSDISKRALDESASVEAEVARTKRQTESHRSKPSNNIAYGCEINHEGLSGHRKRSIAVYNDNLHDQSRGVTKMTSSTTNFNDYPFLQHSGAGHHGLPHPHNMSFFDFDHQPQLQTHRYASSVALPRAKESGATRHRSLPVSRQGRNDKENIEPVLDQAGFIDDEAGCMMPENGTQRYFSADGAHPPHFFQVLPPQMQLGGFYGSEFCGHSLNPLTLNFQHQVPLRPYHSPQPPSRRAVSPRRRMTKAGGPEPDDDDCFPGLSDGLEDGDRHMLFDDENF